jgi:hypothetical protein
MPAEEAALRTLMNTLGILLILMLIYAVGTPNPRPDPGPLLSAEELKQSLNDSLTNQPPRGARQLIGLSEQYRPLMIHALENRYENVRLAAVDALALIGDAESIKVLCEYLQEVHDNRDLAIGTAEALSKAHARSAIPVIREVLEANQDRYVQEYLNRAIERIENPGHFVPLVETRFGGVITNFLMDDIQAIYFEDKGTEYKERRPYYFNEDEWQHILTLVRRAKAGVPGGYPIRQSLVIELKDGREARLRENKGVFHYMNDSYFFHSNNEHYCMESSELSEYLKGHASND